MKLLSIIIPHYNSPDLLEKILESIPAFDEIEIIVIDDNSKINLDRYERLTSSEKYSSITFVNNYTGKQGAGAARNIGIDKATGKWVLFADADDYFVPGFYDKVKKYFNSDYDVVFFKSTSVYLDTGQVAERHVFYNKLINDYLASRELKHEMALRYYYHIPCGKMIKKHFLKKNIIKFDEVIASNDVMFSAKVGFYMKQFAMDENVIYCITRGSGSLTMSIEEHIYDTRLNVFINYYKYLDDELTREEFRALNLYGWGKVVDVLKYRLGLKKLVEVFLKLKRNNIRIMDIKLFNPFISLKKLFNYIKRYNNEKKYMGRS